MGWISRLLDFLNFFPVYLGLFQKQRNCWRGISGWTVIEIIDVIEISYMKKSNKGAHGKDLIKTTHMHYIDHQNYMLPAFGRRLLLVLELQASAEISILLRMAWKNLSQKNCFWNSC
jgi:hypothetical protein